MRTKAELWQWLQDTYHDGLKSNDIMLISGNRFLKFMHDFELVVMRGQDQDGVDLNTVVEEDVLPRDRRNYRVSIPASNYTQDYLSLSPQTPTASVDAQSSVNVSSNVAVESTSTTSVSVSQIEDVNNSDVNSADASRVDDKVAESSSNIAPGFRPDENLSNIDAKSGADVEQTTSTVDDDNRESDNADTTGSNVSSNSQSEYDDQDAGDSETSHGSTYSDLDNKDADDDSNSIAPQDIGSTLSSDMNSEVSSVVSSSMVETTSESTMPSEISTSVDAQATSQAQSTNNDLNSEDQDHSEYSDSNSLSDLPGDNVGDSQTGLKNLMYNGDGSKFGMESGNDSLQNSMGDVENNLDANSNEDMPF